MAAEQLQVMKDLNENASKQDVSKYDLVLVGGGAWDLLHRFVDVKDQKAHALAVSDLVEQMKLLKNMGVPVVWMTPTTINTPALNTPEKREHMTEEDMRKMRARYDEIGVRKAASFVVEGPSFSKERVGESFDGVHYPPDVYSAGAQILANAFDWLLPEVEVSDKFTAPEPGKMARPFLGLMMLCLCFIGLFFFDGFFGFSYLACLFVKGILPSDLYFEAFSALHEKSELPPLSFTTGGGVIFSENTQKTRETNGKDVRTKKGNDSPRNRKKASQKSQLISDVDDEIAALLGDTGDIEVSRFNR